LAGSTSVTYGELMLSPDGTRLLFAADGDDGYSRLWTVPTAGGRATAISGRRDGYAIGWTKDGKGILFIEGNAFQGQSTSLWLSDLNGHNRKLLVAGATL
jgi:Tol biopolymer transport system component